MYQKRQCMSKVLPLPRKGAKYVARASSHNTKSLPLIIALRDMLSLVKTTNEAKKLISQGIIKINGRPAHDHRESIKLLNVLEAGKQYVLSLSSVGKFSFQESKSKDEYLAKVIGKTAQKNNKMQLNLHDGSNIMLSSKDKIAINDSLYLDFNRKPKKHIPLEKGKSVLIISGKYTGKQGKVQDIDSKKVIIKIDGKEEPTSLDLSRVIAQ